MKQKFIVEIENDTKIRYTDIERAIAKELLPWFIVVKEEKI